VTEGWRRRITAGGVHSVLQTLVLALAILAWRRSPGWVPGQVVLYFAALVILAPVVGRVLARKLLRAKGPLRLWRAWPVGLATLLVLLFGHGFEDAGLGPAAPLVTLGVLAFGAGVASSWTAVSAEAEAE